MIKTLTPKQKEFIASELAADTAHEINEAFDLAPETLELIESLSPHWTDWDALNRFIRAARPVPKNTNTTLNH